MEDQGGDFISELQGVNYQIALEIFKRKEIKVGG
jgi:hypothetical protein